MLLCLRGERTLQFGEDLLLKPGGTCEHNGWRSIANPFYKHELSNGGVLFQGMHLPLSHDDSPKDNLAAGALLQRRGDATPPLPWTTFSPPRTGDKSATAVPFLQIPPPTLKPR